MRASSAFRSARLITQSTRLRPAEKVGRVAFSDEIRLRQLGVEEEIAHHHPVRANGLALLAMFADEPGHLLNRLGPRGAKRADLHGQRGDHGAQRNCRNEMLQASCQRDHQGPDGGNQGGRRPGRHDTQVDEAVEEWLRPIRRMPNVNMSPAQPAAARRRSRSAECEARARSIWS